LARAKEKAKQTTCISNLKQIGLALTMYPDDNDGYWPIVSYTDANGVSRTWAKELAAFIPQKGSAITSLAGPVFDCPSTVFDGVAFENLSLTYSASAVLFGLNGSTLTVKVARKSNGFINPPTETPLVCEGKQSAPSSPACATGAPWILSTGLGVQTDLTKGNPGEMTYLDFRHGAKKSMDILYGDASVRVVPSVNSASNSWTRTLWENR